MNHPDEPDSEIDILIHVLLNRRIHWSKRNIASNRLISLYEKYPGFDWENRMPLLIEVTNTGYYVAHQAHDLIIKLGPRAVSSLVENLNNQSYYVRRSCVSALEKIMIEHPNFAWETIIPDLEKMLDDKNKIKRLDGAKLMVRIGDAAVPTILEALNQNPPKLRLEEVILLCRVNDLWVVPPLVNTMKSKSKWERKFAAHALSQIGISLAHADTSKRSIPTRMLEDSIIPALIDAFEDRDSVVLIIASQGLRNIGKPAIPALTCALKDGTYSKRAIAAATLGLIGDDSAIPNLIEASINDENRDVRYKSGKAIEEIRRVPALMERLEDLTKDERYYLLDSWQRSTPLLVKAALHQKINARLMAISILIKIAENHPEFDWKCHIQYFIKLLKEEHTIYGAGNLIKTIAEKHPEYNWSDAFGPLLCNLKDPFSGESSRIALVKIGMPAAQALLDALMAQDTISQIKAAVALQEIIKKCNNRKEIDDFEGQFHLKFTSLASISSIPQDNLLQILALKKRITERKNELAPYKDIILRDRPKPPKKQGKKMYREIAGLLRH